MKITTAELRSFFSEQFPQAPITIEHSESGFCRVKYQTEQKDIRPGNTIAGPVMVWLVDCATYGAILTEIGIVPLAVTTNISLNFLRKPLAGSILIGEARILKLGKRLVVTEVRVIEKGKTDLLAHGTLTYSIPPEER